MAVYPRFAISVCSGYGGIDLGIRLAMGEECRTILYCEREAFPASVLVAEMESGCLAPAPVWSDLHSLPTAEIIGRLGVRPSDVILHGGIPCQPWSNAGQRKGRDDERWLWPAFWRVAQDGGLGWVFLENVRGFVSGDDPGIDRVLRDLSLAGWNAEWDLFSASECGAPHERERVFVLAHAPGVGELHVGDSGSGRRRKDNSGRCNLEREGGIFSGGEENSDRIGCAGDVGDANGTAKRGKVASCGCRDFREDSPEKRRNPNNQDVANAGHELANSGGSGLQRRERRGAFRESAATPGSIAECSSFYWPARSGEEQLVGEPPRIVVYAKGGRHDGRRSPSVRENDGAERTVAAGRRTEAEPGLGGNADGRAAVVDKRLGRLWAGRISALGNGVVPIVAGFAFVTLWRRLFVNGRDIHGE